MVGQTTTGIVSYAQMTGSANKQITRVWTDVMACAWCSANPLVPTSDAQQVGGTGTLTLHNAGIICNNVYAVRPRVEYKFYDANYKTWRSGTFTGAWYYWPASTPCTQLPGF